MGEGVVQVVGGFLWGDEWAEGIKGANVKGIEGEQRVKRWEGGGISMELFCNLCLGV